MFMLVKNLPSHKKSGPQLKKGQFWFFRAFKKGKKRLWKRAKIKKRVDPSSCWSKISLHTRNEVSSSKTVNFNIKRGLLDLFLAALQDHLGEEVFGFLSLPGRGVTYRSCLGEEAIGFFVVFGNRIFQVMTYMFGLELGQLAA